MSNFEWPGWWNEGKLGNRRQLRQLVHDLWARAVEAEHEVIKLRAKILEAKILEIEDRLQKGERK